MKQFNIAILVVLIGFVPIAAPSTATANTITVAGTVGQVL